jgi:hypothetical protein
MASAQEKRKIKMKREREISCFGSGLFFSALKVLRRHPLIPSPYEFRF